MTLYRAGRLAPALLLAAALACGGGDAPESNATADESGDPTPASATGGGADAAAPPTQTAGGGSQGAQTLAAEDVERWDRGMAAELKAVQEAGERLKAARTGQDTLSAMSGAMEMNTVEIGAKAAGVDVERYRMIQSTLSRAAVTLAPVEAGGMDTTQMPAEMRAQVRESREQQLTQLRAELPAPVIEALEPRAAELQKRSLELAFMRVKAAGG